MVDERLKAYVEDLKKRGYAESQIKEQLISSGYPEKTINELFPGKSHLLHIILIFAFVALISFGILILPSFFKETIVSVKLSLLSKSVKINQPLQYTTKLQSNTKTSASIKTEVLDFESSKIVFSAKEKIDLKEETTLSKTIPINESFEPGRYLLRTKITYDDKTTGTSTEFYIEKKAEKKESVKIPTKTPTKTSQGKIPTPTPQIIEQIKKDSQKILFAQECPIECDDYNACTKDACVKGRCEFKSLIPCCGNLLCEQGESIISCMGDCMKREKTDEEKISEAKNVVKKDKEKAAALCNSVADISKLDSCLADLADESGLVQFCQPIQSTKTKDSCYSFLAIKGTYSCSNINDRLLRNSCISLESSKKSLQTVNEIQQSINSASAA